MFHTRPVPNLKKSVKYNNKQIEDKKDEIKKWITELNIEYIDLLDVRNMMNTINDNFGNDKILLILTRVYTTDEIDKGYKMLSSDNYQNIKNIKKMYNVNDKTKNDNVDFNGLFFYRGKVHFIKKYMDFTKENLDFLIS
jgi:hypothetical protein